MLLSVIYGKSRLILLGLVLAAGVIWFLLRSGQSPKEIRHVLLISIDTCRADYLSCYGYFRQTTPNIDKFAEESILFTNVISPVPMTLPAHGSMLTGTIPLYHGIHDNFDYRLDESNVTLAEILKEAGFTTGAIISAFVLDSQFGLDQGFDSYNDQFEEEHMALNISERKGGEANRFALQWLEQHKDEKFFLFLHYFDPHYGYEPPEPFASRFSDSPYAGEIAYTDDCIGLVMKKLKDLGLYDSSLIIITGDHGEMLGEHGEGSHSYFIYQSAIKVPLIFRLPGQRRSKRIEGLVGIVDITPTVCGLLGIDVPRQVQGKDLSSYLLGKNLPNRQRHMYCESIWPTKYNANSLLGVVTNRFKYIQTTRPELYDLTKDPQETKNLIKLQPQQGRILQVRLREILEHATRKAEPESHVVLDERSRKRLESLGYVSGSVSEDFTFDQTKDDPKDLIAFHVASADVFVLISEKRYAEAKILCQRMLSEKPDYEGTYRHLSTIAEKQGDKAKAVTYMAEALKLRPDNVQTRNKLAAMLVAQGKLDEAISHCRQALQINPNFAGTHYNLGNALQSQGKLDEAISHYRQALQINPDHAKAHNNLGAALQSQGKLNEAISYLTRAIQLDPDSALAHKNLGTALQSQGKLNEAISCFTRAIQLDPDSALAHHNLGTVLQSQGKLNEAISHYRQAVQIKPDYARAHNNLGIALQSQGKLNEAISCFTRAIQLDPDSALAHNNLGTALQSQGKLDEAISHYRQALQINPDHAKAHNNLGAALQSQGKLNEAISCFTRAIQLDPDSALAHNNLGLMLASQGKLDEAITHFRKVVQLNPGSARAHYILARALKNGGRTKEAITEFKETLRLKPDWVIPMSSLAWLLATHKEDKFRDPKEAIRLAEWACELTNYKNPGLVDTLAAAYAAAGRFSDAVKTAQRAFDLAESANQQRLRDKIKKRLDLYKNGQPYHDSAGVQ